MKKGLSLALAVIMIICVSFTNAFAEEEKAESAHWVGGTLTFTTDYMFRGYSLSSNNPAIQGSFDYAHTIGIFAGIFGSSWDGTEIDSQVEIDFYAGFANAFAGVDYDLRAVYYYYPGHAPELIDPIMDTANYWEFHIGLGYGFDIPLAPRIGVNYDYSPEYYAEDGTGHHFSATLDFTLPHNIGLGGEYGYQDIEGDKYSGADGLEYNWWRVRLGYAILGFDLDLSYWGADDDLKEWLGPNCENLADDRVEFTVSRSFE